MRPYLLAALIALAACSPAKRPAPPAADTTPPRGMPSDSAFHNPLGGLRRGAAVLVAPRVTGFSAGLAGDSILQSGTTVYAKNLVATDTVRFDYYLNDSLFKTRRYPRTWDSLKVAAPAYGVTARYKGCVQVERAGKKYPAVPPCWTWVFTRGPAPVIEPTVDSVARLATRVVPLVPGGPFAQRIGQLAPTDSNRAQVCVFAVLKSGKRVKTQNSWNNPRCEAAFQQFLLEATT